MTKNEDLPTKGEIIRERWLRGKLSYKLHAGQLRLRQASRQATHQLFVGECARQFGKSYESIIDHLELAIQKPNARLKYGTAFHSDLVEFILPNFDVALGDCPNDLRPRYMRAGSKFIFDNGSEIKLVGVDRNPNGLRGNAIDLITLDEAAFINNLDYLYKSIIMPATTHRPNCRIKMISTPPSSPAHDFLDYAEKAEFEGSYCKLTIYDNPMVNEATIKRLMTESGGENSSTWRREYLCAHILDSNLAIVQEWDEKFVEDRPRDKYYPFYHRYSSMDLGVKDNTAVIFGYYDFVKASLILEEEYVINGPDLTTEVLKNEIKKKEQDLGWITDPYLRVSDSNNPLLLQDLSFLHKLHFVPTDKGTLEEMINTLRLMVSKGQIIVHPRCKQLRGCLKYGVWDKNRQKFAQSKVYGHFDALAALVYLVRNLNRSTNPIPPDFQVDFDNQIMFPHQRETQSVRDLKKAFNLRR
jgi:hypothetical protein